MSFSKFMSSVVPNKRAEASAGRRNIKSESENEMIKEMKHGFIFLLKKQNDLRFIIH